MRFFRPTANLTGKRLYAHSVATFMVLQRVQEPEQLEAQRRMPARVIEFLLKDSEMRYWHTNGWIKRDPFNEYIHLTTDGAEKIQKRISNNAGGQSVSREEVENEYLSISGKREVESLVSIEYNGGEFSLAPLEFPASIPTTNAEPPRQLFAPELNTDLLGGYVYPDELPDSVEYWEGIPQQVLVNKYERSVAAREECMAYYGCICQTCNLDFSKQYGDRGKGFIHVHHIVPLSAIGRGYDVNPIQDLIPVCPNCHAMLHRSEPPISIAELRKILANEA